MQVLLLGGSGDIGFNVLEYFGAMRWIKRLIIADNHIKLGQEKLKNSPIKIETDLIPVQLGEEKNSMLQLMKQCDFVINCIGPFSHYGVSIAQTAIEAGIHCIDICDELNTTKKIFAMRNFVLEKGILLLTGMGWSPGMTNLAVKKISRDLQEIEKVQISLCSNSSSIKGLGMITHLLYCVRENPLFYQDGRLVKPGQHQQEQSIIHFLPPFNEVMVKPIVHPELYTLPRYIPGIHHIQVQGALTPPWISQLVFRLTKFPLFRSNKYLEGLASLLYRYQLLFSGSHQLFSAFRIDVWGKKDREKQHRVLQLVDKKGNMVGISVATAFKMLLEQHSLPPDVYAPEGCLDPEEFFNTIGSYGLEIMEIERETVLGEGEMP